MEAVVCAMGISLSAETRPGRDGGRWRPSGHALGAGSANMGMNPIYGHSRDRFHARRSTVIGIRDAVRLPVTAHGVSLGQVIWSVSRLVAGPFDRSRPRIPRRPYQAGVGREVNGQMRRWYMDRATVIEDRRRAVWAERGQGRVANSVPPALAERATA